jgi:hypothetical protein
MTSRFCPIQRCRITGEPPEHNRRSRLGDTATFARVLELIQLIVRHVHSSRKPGESEALGLDISGKPTYPALTKISWAIAIALEAS